MFVTVMFGGREGCWEDQQRVPRQRYQPCPDSLCALPVTIALLAEDGHLVNLGEGLEEGPSPVPSLASILLQERGTYVLVQIIKGEAGAPTRYESLLENLDDWCPELAVELRWLSGLPPVGDGWRRRAGTQRSHQEQGPPSRPRRVGSLQSRTH
ncbi:uncharacterized protein C22orf15 homolog [Phacochoerus africanus]|uniref:uncharacterized protein C22orf15 homolog n=1 Tax=Phacochoerus africanus TaxID=41426 RepID=UPI001FD9E934|nr:uncharacterized protein C22orf15 homolog [Phacochoerus africanus]